MSFDLLILDVDGTIAPHTTVAIANEIAKNAACKVFGWPIARKKRLLSTSQVIGILLRNLFARGIAPSTKMRDYSRLAKIMYLGCMLYLLRGINNVKNMLGVQASNQKLIQLFLAVIKLGNLQEYSYTKSELEESLYPCIKHVIKSFKKAKKVIISHGISSNKACFLRKFKDILGLDEIISNKATYDKDGKLSSYKIVIKSARDKRQAALKLMRKYKAKKVALFGNDYEDIGIAKLAKFVVANRPPLRLRKVADIVVNDNYCKLKYI